LRDEDELQADIEHGKLMCVMCDLCVRVCMCTETRKQKFIHCSDAAAHGGVMHITALAVSPNKRCVYVCVSERERERERRESEERYMHVMYV